MTWFKIYYLYQVNTTYIIFLSLSFDLTLLFENQAVVGAGGAGTVVVVDVVAEVVGGVDVVVAAVVGAADVVLSLIHI